MNIDKKTEEQEKIDITDFLNMMLYELKDIRAQFGREPKNIDIDELLKRFREAGINATYRQ